MNVLPHATWSITSQSPTMPHNISLAPHTVSHIADNNTWTLCIDLKIAYNELYLDKRYKTS